MSDNEDRIQSFEEFWPYYLEEHSKPANRRLHQIGTSMAIGAFSYGLLTRRKWLMLAAPVLGYGPAWVGHFFIEGNRPATFKYPRWSLMGDFKMNVLMWSGELDAELERYGIGDFEFEGTDEEYTEGAEESG